MEFPASLPVQVRAGPACQCPARPPLQRGEERVDRRMEKLALGHPGLVRLKPMAAAR